jgi:threonine dehydrogenase-like Zn-dependent dehydrogenase
MKAIVFHGIGDTRLEDVPEPTLEQPTDAIARLTTSAICGTDLHFIRGTFEGVDDGTILGHEGVGIVEKKGEGVRNFQVGDRVVVASTVACGCCSYCRAGYYRNATMRIRTVRARAPFSMAAPQRPAAWRAILSMGLPDAKSRRHFALEMLPSAHAYPTVVKE